MDSNGLRQPAKPLPGFASPGRAPFCASGKMAWLQAQFGPGFRDVLIGYNKPLLSQPGFVLIDDSDANCEKFVNLKPPRQPGRAIVFPRPWNAMRAESHRAVDYVLQQLLED